MQGEGSERRDLGARWEKGAGGIKASRMVALCVTDVQPTVRVPFGVMNRPVRRLSHNRLPRTYSDFNGCPCGCVRPS